MSVKNSKKENIFDPMNDLLLAQSSRPPQLRSVNMRTLTPFQRALMTIDGTVTKFIEAYTMEPVQVTRISQSEQPLEKDHTWLEVEKDSPVTVREVYLHGEYSQTVHAYAVTLIVPDAINTSVDKGLKTQGGSVGRLLRSSKMETYREVLWYGRQQFDSLPKPLELFNGKEFLSRTYRIISEGKPIMMINENFPLYSHDESPLHH